MIKVEERPLKRLMTEIIEQNKVIRVEGMPYKLLRTEITEQNNVIGVKERHF